jgi:hercynylcysteine S-oxide lyase
MTFGDKKQNPQFGTEFGKKYFGFGKSVVNLNHGSFGAIPTQILDARVKHMKEIANFPDAFFKFEVFPRIEHSRKLMAEFLDADEDNLVLVTNATTALNTVLRSYPLNIGDKILFCSTIYGSCLHTLQFLENRQDIVPVEVTLEYPLSDDQIVEIFTKAMEEHNPRIVFFDTVSSSPSAIIPWERLVEKTREHGALSCVDGAHGAGLIPISLRTARPDFFTTNLHKWLFVPNSCAVFYVDKKHHRHIHTMPVSAYYVDDKLTLDPKKEKTRLGDMFVYTGTIDYSAMLTIPDALKFRSEVCGGEEAIREYCVNLAKEAGALAAKEFGTEVMTGGSISDSLDIVTSLVNVRLPLDIPKAERGKVGGDICEYLYRAKDTFAPVFEYNDALWVRFSAQIYLGINDFVYGIQSLKDAFKDLGLTVFQK